MNDNIKDLVGQRFGRLLVMFYDGQNKHRQSVWMCVCDCGAYVKVARPRLVSGNTTSCGCYNKEVVSLPTGEASFNKVFYYYKQNAERRDLEFDLKKEEFKNLIFSDCYYCGKEPSTRFRHSSGKYVSNGEVTYNGIDRLDNSKGYVLENSVSCCPDCNYAKRKMSVHQFTKWIDKLSKSSFFILRKFGGSHSTLIR